MRRARATQPRPVEFNPETLAYAAGCKSGEIEAEAYLRELREKPDFVGAPIASAYLRRFGVFSNKPLGSLGLGQVIGFMSRVERELA